MLAIPAASSLLHLFGRSTSSYFGGPLGSLVTVTAVASGFAYIGWILPTRIAGPAVRSVRGVRRPVAMLGLVIGSVLVWSLVSVAMDPVLAVGLPLGPVAFALASLRAPRRPTFRVGVVPALVGVAVLWFALRPGRVPLAAVGVAAAGAMLVHVLAGHAAESSPSWFNVGVQWFHVLAVGVWIGGLVWLLFSLTWPSDGKDRTGTIRRYSLMAGFALAVVALTGLSRALDEVGWPQRWSRLFHTSFGLTVLAKVALFVPLVALGARNRSRNVPAATGAGRVRPLARTAAAELAIAALIFAATGLLSELAPAATVANAAPRQQTPQRLALPRPLGVRRVLWRTARRVVTRQPLWNANRERLRNALSWQPERSIVRWAWTQHTVYREPYAAAMRDPAFAHLAFHRLRSPAEVRAFLAASGRPTSVSRPE